MMYQLDRNTDLSYQRMLIMEAKRQGLSVCQLLERELGEWVFTYDPDAKENEIVGYFSTTALPSKLVTVGEMLDLIMTASKPVKVKLNEKYTAKIYLNRKLVEVGCQSIPFEAVLKVAEVINRNKKKEK